MKLGLTSTKKYKKNLRRVVRSGFVKREEVDFVVQKIINRKRLPLKYKDHRLNGKFRDCRECHIRSDVLLIYQIIEKECILILIDIGSHSNLFR